MTLSDTSDGTLTTPVGDLAALQRRATALAQQAEAASQAYERTVWIRYTLIFVPIPLLVVTFRLHLVAWHYYIVGAVFLAVALVIYVLDLAAVARRDHVVETAQRAKDACSVARASPPDARWSGERPVEQQGALQTPTGKK